MNGGTTIKCHCNLRNVRDKMADGKTSYEKMFGARYDDLLISFGARVSTKLISSKYEARLHLFGKHTIQGIFMGHVLREGGGLSGNLHIADGEDSENCRHPVFTSVSFQAPGSRTRRDLSFPRADGSLELSDLHQSHAAKCSPEENPDQDFLQKKEEESILEEGNGKCVWCMSGDFICRHHVVHRTKLHIPHETNLSMIKNTSM